MADLRRPSNHRRKRQSQTFLSFISAYTVPTVCVYVVLIGWLSFVNSEGCKDCDQGKCVNETCECFRGWMGARCNACYGRISLPAGKAGVIHDGSANYSKDLSCSWLLDAQEPNLRIQFIINEFATECVWDHLYIHDGDSAYAPLVAAYSGIIWSSRGKPRLKFKMSGRYAFIHFYSDAAYTLPGFNISYLIDDCALDCSENAECQNSSCVCEPGWTGVNCDTMIIDCPNNCSGHGNCAGGVCNCDPDYRGEDCNVTKGNLYVESITPSLLELTGRASMSFTADDKGDLWVFGGYRMGNIEDSNNLFKYNLQGQIWERVPEIPAGSKRPWPRYGHTTVYYKNAFYLYGGVSGTELMKDLWKYDIQTRNWAELTGGPRNISGHSAHVVNDKMIIIFGYSPVYGYSNKVLSYEFVSEEWTVVETFGSQVQGSYGHTSVYDARRDKIYVYGGYQSQSSSTYNLTDKLYQYDPVTREWFILHSSGKAQYLHSAALMHGLMITFGGNTHNDTRVGTSPKCFASDFMAYDRDCNSWYTINSAHLSPMIDTLDRFGHAMVAVNNTIYVFGGFSSTVKKDLLKITAGDCDYYKNQSSCDVAVPGVKCVWQVDKCVADDKSNSSCRKPQDPNASCSGYNTCNACQNASSQVCHWCGNTCTAPPTSNQNCTNCTEDQEEELKKFCGLFHSCTACHENEKCQWQSNTCTYMNSVKDSSAGKKSCPTATCSSQNSCEDCTKINCMWCSNLAQCIDTNSYLVSFHYGQCMDWTTKVDSCQANNCSLLKTCSECQARPRCGWCNDATGTGTGVCMDGGMSGPVELINGSATVDSRQCPANRWFFNDCPKCQCNGHSTCVTNTSICENCKFPTAGPQCQYCSDGYYGAPENGGNCKKCFCNDHADTCDPSTGDCYCRTRGVTGRTCDRCDDGNKYSGDPKNGGTCHYQLNTDFQYTFNLSKPEDKNYTQINFLNIPTSSDRDVDFTLNCSGDALLNITYKSKSYPEEKEYVSGRACDYFRTKFEHKNHAFGGKENTTFLVYVYNFKTPFTLQISFVQQDKINLLKFFIIFFSCFLSLLLIAAALWKIKHKYDSYRRRQQLIVEMQQMASRPFSTIHVEIDRKSDPATVDKKDHLDSVLRRRKKVGNKPSAVAIEPLADHKAAILTLIIQLPTGNSDYSPSGQSGMAVGSALVSIGSNRKQSLEHIKGDKPKIRKNLSYNHPDTCA